MSDDASRPRAAAWRPTMGGAAPEALGERLGGVFIDDGGTWVIKAVARTDADYASVQDAAQRLGVEGSFRVENAGQSWRELMQLTDEVTAYLRSAGVRFTFSLGPDMHREVVELTMAAADQERRIGIRSGGLPVSWKQHFVGVTWSLPCVRVTQAASSADGLHAADLGAQSPGCPS
jgi:hypothetical protein